MAEAEATCSVPFGRQDRHSHQLGAADCHLLVDSVIGDLDIALSEELRELLGRYSLLLAEHLGESVEGGAVVEQQLLRPVVGAW